MARVCSAINLHQGADMKKADKITPSKAECHTAAGIRADSAVSPEERQNMIAAAAYSKAECRGFTEGCELEDWLAAEAEIDQLLKPN
jgi:hypothetical protein